MQPSVTPAFILDLELHWPFACRLDHCQLAFARFDSQLLLTEDFAAQGVPPCKGGQKRQAEFLAGRICAARALKGLGMAATLPGRHPENGLPLWPAGVRGSISHSHGMAVAIAGNARQWRSLGLDLEKTMGGQRAQRLRQAILTPTEQHWLDDHPADQAGQRLTLLFAAKESLFKALNPLCGTYFGFQDAEVVEYDADRLGLRLLRDLSDEFRSGMLFHARWAAFGHGMLSLVALPRTDGVPEEPSGLSG